MKSNKLTNKQEHILIFIKKYIAKNDYPPTVREIAHEVNLSSPATVHVHLQNLIQKGYIRRNKRNKRILELLVPNEFEKVVSNELDITLIENKKKNSSFRILKDSISKNGNLIAFRMDNDTINSFGIFKGDILIFNKVDKFSDNDIVLVKKDNVFQVVSNYISNKDYMVVGKLIRLYREYK